MIILMDEQQLLALLKKGEATAVAHWYQQFNPQLQAYLRQKLDNDKDVEEIAQEVFMNCLHHLPLFRGGSSIFTWMVSIARHEVADYYRKKYAKKALQYLPLGEVLLKQEIHNASETSEKVKQVLATMKKESGELLMKKYVDRQQVKKIALELGRTVKAVESDLFRARLEFRQLYLAYEAK